MSIKENNLIFDLDGTLIDSAPGILTCLSEIFNLNNIQLENNLNYSIIGPPLKETLKYLIRKQDLNKIDYLESEFIKLYDSKYSFKTQLYDGVMETLEMLYRKKKLILITNKRFAPTRIILENTNIIHFFENYFCVDANDQKKKDKTTLIASTIKDLNLKPVDSIYIGDTNGDLIASKKNNIKFAFAGWGYGNCDDFADLSFKNISELV
tara:strand:+ start:158 stop:784 length:627 start_codon:yes stop_codon:yes gene_type:complete